MRFYSPLRYPGGKRRLVKHIVRLFELNNYTEGKYIEPFAGGAGAALELLFKGYVESICINDLDISIYSFWHSVLNHTEELCKLIVDTPVTIEEWKKQKIVQENFEKVSLLELGFSTFYLNRTNISGIIKGGVIGGYKQDKKNKIDARFNKKNLVYRIEKIALYKNSIEISNLCAKNLIEEYIGTQDMQCFIYLDPPYYCKGPELYKNHLTHEDHSQIATLVKSIQNHYWMVTYDNVKEIKEMYDGFRNAEYTLSYSAGKATTGKEIMFFSNNLQLPYKDDKIEIIL